MGEKPKYFDTRTDFFRGFFERGIPYEEYVNNGNPTHSARWRDFEKRLVLNADQRKIIGNWTRRVNIVVLSGLWCGDCARQGPMLRAIENNSKDLLHFRYLDNQENPGLQDELKINGASKVPVVVALSEDFFELERFGDRHLSVYRKKLVSELGPACDPGLLPPLDDELSIELGEWINFFDRLQIMLRLAPLLRSRYKD